MTYIITNEHTGRSFETISMFEVSLDSVWQSVQYLFMPGTSVLIIAPDGKSQRYCRRQRRKRDKSYH